MQLVLAEILALGSSGAYGITAALSGNSAAVIFSVAAWLSDFDNWIGAGYSLTDGEIDTIDALVGLLTREIVVAHVCPGGGDMSRALYLHKPASGTMGGTFTAGAWRTRVLDTEQHDPDAIGTLLSNQVTIQAGAYFSEFDAGGYRVGDHQTRLWDVTHEAELAIGSSEFSSNTTGVMNTRSIGRGGFTVEEETVIELQHRCQYTKATNGQGQPCSWTNEIYAQLELFKL